MAAHRPSGWSSVYAIPCAKCWEWDKDEWK